MPRVLTLMILFGLAFHFETYSYARTQMTAEEYRAEAVDKNGVLLNVPGRKRTPRVAAAEKELYEILSKLLSNDPRSKNFEWQIKIYNSSRVNAWATLKESAGSKPVAMISITTAFLSRFKTNSELAFILGHEATHHLEGHTEKDNHSNIAEQWFHMQSDEVAADKGAVDLMKGHFALDAARLIQERMLDAIKPTEAKTKKSRAALMQNQLQKSIEGSASTHHSEGVRLSLLQIEIETAKRVDQRVIHGIDHAISPVFQALTARPAPETQTRQSTIKFFNEFVTQALSYEDGSFNHLPELEYNQLGIHQGIAIWLTPEPTWFLNHLMDQIAATSTDNHLKAQTLFLILFSNFYDGFFPTALIDDFLNKLDALTSQRLFRILLGLKQSEMPDYFIDRSASLAHLFAQTSTFQKLMHALSERNPAWAAFVDQSMKSASQSLFPSENEMYLDPLYRSVPLEEKVTDAGEEYLTYKGPLQRRVIKEMLERLAETSVESFEEFDLKRIMTILNFAERQPAKDFFAKDFGPIWQNAFKPFKAQLDEMYESAARGTTVASPTKQRREFIEIWFKKMSINPDWVDHANPLLILQLIASLKNEPYSSDHYTFRHDLYNSYQFAEKMIHLYYRTLGSHQDRGFILKFLFSIFDSNLLVVFKKNVVLTDLMRRNFGTKSASGRFVDTFLFGEGKNDLRKISYKDQHVVVLYLLGNRLNFLAELGFLEQMKRTGQVQQADFNSILSIFEAVLTAQDQLYKYTDSPLRDVPPSSAALLEWTFQNIDKEKDLKKKIQMLDRTIRILGLNFMYSPEEKSRVAAIFLTDLKSLSGTHLIEVLKRPSIRRGLNQTYLNELLQKSFRDLVPLTAPRSTQLKIWTDLSTAFDFLASGRPLGVVLRNALAETYQAQPTSVDQVFPLKEVSDTEILKNASLQLRGWSGFNNLIQSQSVLEQLQAIEYLMGRSNQIPKFVTEIDSHTSSNTTTEAAIRLRAELSASHPMIRSFFVNSLFHGKSAPLMGEANRETLINHLLRGIPNHKKEVAKALAYASFEAEGINASLMVSAMLGQIAEKGSTAISEETILKIILDSFGVPGWKLAQYMAFTGEFKDYSEILASYQDSAPAPGYFEILMYLQRHLSHLLDLNRFKILALLGAGSVNLAIEYKDLRTNTTHVINIPREHIIQKTGIDFKRFRNFMQKLAARSSRTMDFTFLVGLSNVIEESVKLEFDREAVLQRQKDAVLIYDHIKMNGWTIQTVDARGKYGDAILMDKAGILTGRKMLEKDPEVYKQALRAVYDFEFELLFKKVADGVIRLANPDLHDGQVLVDPASKTVSVIDFGQAVRLTSSDRELGFDIISMVEGLKTKSEVIQVLQMHLKRVRSQEKISWADLESVFKVKDPMDRFVRLISLMHIKKGDLPIGSIHLVLGVNRLAKLGKKVGRFSTISLGRHFVLREIVKKFSRTSYRMQCSSLFSL